MSTLSLDQVVNVKVYLEALAAVRKAFNLGLIIGAKTVIPTDERVRIYRSVDGMLEDGFTDVDPEVKAAQLYFDAQPRPDRLAVGVKASAETAVQALQACRAANSEWYVFSYLGAEKADITALAAAVESMKPSTVQFYTTDDDTIPTGATGNLFSALKALKYQRSLGQYSTENDYAIVSIMGYAMGQNTGLANSAYSLDLKGEVGVTAESLTETEYEKIVSNNGNVYVNRGEAYSMFQPGVMADGTWFDELINLDKLSNDIQLQAMDAFKKVPKIAQTEDGITYLLNKLQEPLEQAVKIGFVAPGRWTGPDILTLKQNDMLRKGYLILAEPITDQPQADREARKAPGIYIPVKLAGAIHEAVIGVYVNR